MITPVLPVFGELRQKDEVSSKLAWAIKQDCLKMSQAKKKKEPRQLVAVVCPGGLCFLQAVTRVSWRKELSPPRP